MSKKLSRNIEDMKNTDIQMLEMKRKISEMRTQGIEEIAIETI